LKKTSRKVDLGTLVSRGRNIGREAGSIYIVTAGIRFSVYSRKIKERATLSVLTGAERKSLILKATKKPS